jgi:hypothetical protein
MIIDSPKTADRSNTHETVVSLPPQLLVLQVHELLLLLVVGEGHLVDAVRLLVREGTIACLCERPMQMRLHPCLGSATHPWGQAGKTRVGRRRTAAWPAVKFLGKERWRAGLTGRDKDRVPEPEKRTLRSDPFFCRMVPRIAPLLHFSIKHKHKWNETAIFHLTPQPNVTKYNSTSRS